MGRKIDPKVKRNWVHNQLVAFKPEDKRYDVLSDQLPGLKMRVYPTGRKVWLVDYRHDGKRQTYTIGPFPQYSHAQAKDDALKAFTNNPDPASVKAVKKVEEKRAAVKAATGTLRAFLEGDYKKLVLNHKRTGGATEQRIKHVFKDHLDTQMDALDWMEIEKLLVERRDEGISPVTINRDRTALLSLLNSAVERELIPANPLAKLKPLKFENDNRVRWLGQRDQEDRIKVDGRKVGERTRFEKALADNKTPGYLRDLVIVAMNTGLRRGELFGLDWSDVSLQKAQLTVRAATAKAARARHVPLNGAALDVLKARWKASKKRGLVFPSPSTGERLDNVKRSWSELVERARVADFRFHDLRHDFASRLVMAEVDLNTVRELLGHADLKMTLRYSHLAPEHKANAVARLG